MSRDVQSPIKVTDSELFRQIGGTKKFVEQERSKSSKSSASGISQEDSTTLETVWLPVCVLTLNETKERFAHAPITVVKL